MKDCLMKEGSNVRKIAFVGDHLPRKCGIATFTSDLLAAVAAAHPQSQCLSVSVNDIQDGYEYPEVVRFEIEEQDLSSYLRAADFLNISNVDIVCLQHEFGIFGGTAGGHILALLRPDCQKIASDRVNDQHTGMLSWQYPVLCYPLAGSGQRPAPVGIMPLGAPRGAGSIR